MTKIKFREWEFKVDRELTIATYQQESIVYADNCGCCGCKNYVAYRDNVFPAEILQLFDDLGIDFRKDAEVYYLNILTNGLHQISGWFHFKGQILSGQDCAISISMEYTKVTENFSIGFTENNGFTFFEYQTGLVEVCFETTIPWVIDEPFE